MERHTAIPVYDVGSYAEEAELALVRATNIPPSFIANSLAMDGIPVAVMRDNQVPMLAFRQALLLLYVDGISSFGEIVERSGLAENEVRAAFDSMLQDGIVTLVTKGDSSPASRSNIVPAASSPPFIEEMWSFVVAG